MPSRIIAAALMAALTSFSLAVPAGAGTGPCLPGYEARAVGGVPGCYSLATGAVYFPNVPPPEPEAAGVEKETAPEGEAGEVDSGEGTAPEGGSDIPAPETSAEPPVQGQGSGTPAKSLIINIRR